MVKKTGYWLTGIHTPARTHSGPLVAGFFNLSIIIADKTGLVNKTCHDIRPIYASDQPPVAPFDERRTNHYQRPFLPQNTQKRRMPPMIKNRYKPHNYRLLIPAGSSPLFQKYMAERVGFEPTVRCRITSFQD